MPSFGPDTKEDLDKRSEKMRLYWTNALRDIGVPVEDQLAYYDQINNQRKQWLGEISMSNRYCIILGILAFNFLVISRKHRFRRTIFLYGLSSAFLLPEWPLAYIQPAKTIRQLVEEDKSSGKKQEKSAAAEIGIKTIAVAKDVAQKVEKVSTSARSVEDLRKEAEDLVKKQEVERSQNKKQ